MPQPQPLLVFADDWGRHPSSCQHLVRRLTNQFDVLWINTIGTRRLKLDRLTLRRGWEKLRNWGKGVQSAPEGLTVVDVPMLPGLGGRIGRSLNRWLVSSRIRRVFNRKGWPPPVVLTTLPYIADVIRDVDREALIYYCTDDYSHWPSADRFAMEQADRQIAGQADLILAASRALESRHATAGAGNCRYFPHGVDVSHFASAATIATDQILEPIARLRGPRIGFFGLIYEKLDFNLLKAVAQANPEGSLVLIGPEAYCPRDLTAIPNVHLTGPVPYAELPRAVAGLDVLLLPYVDDPMIRQSGPLKLRECLATGKPTVSIDVPDVRPYEPHVRIGRNREEFLENVRSALAESPDSLLRNARRDLVSGDDWNVRADELRQLIEGLRAVGEPNQP
jgi:glycosyltransferase involved in cell wall biosynthesis